MKLTSAINHNRSVISNIQNALSFAEVQDGALQSSATILNRMSELKSLSLDVLKSSSDRANYNTEFNALQQQLHSIATETFNGISLFASDTSSGTFGADVVNVTIFTSDKGAAGSVVSLSKMLLVSALTFTSATSTTAAAAGANNSVALATASPKAHRLCRSDPLGSASSRRHWRMLQPCGQLTRREWQGSNLQKIMQG